jgi:hypothetical protein
MARRLPSVLDSSPTGVPVDLDALELAMENDTQSRTLATLERVFGTAPDADGAVLAPPLIPHPGDPVPFNWDGSKHPRATTTGEFAPATGADAGAIPTPTSAPPLPPDAVRPLADAEAAARTGLSAAQLASFKAVVTVDNFVRRPPAELRGAILLGKTRNQAHNLYWHLAATHGLQPWTKTYPQSLGASYRDHLDSPDCTKKFMDGLFAAATLKDKPIVFVCPNNILKPGKGKYTREEMEYLLADPGRAARTVLVTGADDYIDPAAAEASGKSARQKFDRVRATILGRMPPSPRPKSDHVPLTNPAEFGDFDPALHPHGEHGHWASTAAEPAAAAPVAAKPKRAPAYEALVAPDVMTRMHALEASYNRQLSDAEKRSVEFYTDEDYLELNDPLRDSPNDLSGLSPKHRSLVTNLDAAIRKFPPHDVVPSFRGLNIRDPKKWDAMEKSFREAMASGEPVTLNGFSSASLHPIKAATWGRAVLEIRSPRGALISQYSKHPKEVEVLHTHGERFRVLAVEERRYKTGDEIFGEEPITRPTVVLEALPDAPPPLPDIAKFEFNPDLHPHGEHGHWASTAAEGDGVPAEPEIRQTPPEALASLNAKTVAWSGTLDEYQRGSIMGYTGSMFANINAALRDTPDTMAAVPEYDRRLVRSIDAAIRSYPPHPSPVTSYRGIRRSNPEKLAATEASLKAALASGATVKTDGFLSSSVDPFTAALWGGQVILEIKSPRGAYLGDLSDHPSEKEVLHTHGEQFKVTGFRDSGKLVGATGGVVRRRVYTLEAVPEPPAPLPPPLPGVEFGEFDPGKHPHGEHGRWASTSAPASASPPPEPDPEPPTVLVTRTAGQVPPAVDMAGYRWVQSLDPTQTKALKAYTHQNYKGINSALREHPDLNDPAIGATSRKLAQTLHAALAAAPPFDAPVTSYRGVASRTEKKQRQVREAFRSARLSGEPITLNGFSSASMNPTVASDWLRGKKGEGFVLEIKSKRGVYVASGSENPEELELLHNHGSQFRVTGVREVQFRKAGSLEWPTHTVFTLEEVAGTTPVTSRDRDAVTPEPVAPPARVPSVSFPPVASYVKGLALAAAIGAMPHQTGEATAAVESATNAFKRWPELHPVEDELHPDRLALYKDVQAAEDKLRAARRLDRAAFMAALPPVSPVAWKLDVSGCSAANWNRAFISDSKIFVSRVVSESLGADPRIGFQDGRGPTYFVASGVISAPPRTAPEAFTHEWGHHIEVTAPGVQKLCGEFLAHRRGDEQPVDLVALGCTDVKGATGVKDHFDTICPGRRAYYCGREYPDGGTEILSMGMEALHDDPIGFAKKDPEYFAFVMGVLSGDLVNKGVGHER